jgi:hypothetical protein
MLTPEHWVFLYESYMKCNLPRKNHRWPDESFLGFDFSTETLFRIMSLRKNNWHTDGQESKTLAVSIIRRKVGQYWSLAEIFTSYTSCVLYKKSISDYKYHYEST